MSNPLGYIRHAVANILSSFGEALPNTLIEAQIVETLNISSNCPDGPQEILRNGQCGMLFPQGNSLALAEIMDSVWNNEDKYNKLVQKAKKEVSRFDCQNIMPQIEKLFQELYSKNKK